MSDACFILPAYLVKRYIKDLSEGTAGVHVTGFTAAGGAEASAAGNQELIQRLREHLAFQQQVHTQLNAGATQAILGLAAAPPVVPTESQSIPTEPDQQIYNMEGKVDRKYGQGQHGEEHMPLPGTPVPRDFDPDSRAVYDNTAVVYKFYANVFRRDSLDNHHMKLVSSIHFGQKYANAFWTDLDSQMAYGDGDPRILTNITTSLDVAGHEMTHGFINKASGLEYNGQSGALNESIADVFGLMTKQWHLQQNVTQADWLVGPGTVPYGVALRSFKDERANKYDIQPKNMKQLKAMKRDPEYIDDIEDDWGGVHIFSGVPNHAFYLFATSLGPTSNAFDVAAKVWYDTVASRTVDRNSNFKQFAQLTVNFATGRGAVVKEKLRDAWGAVGITTRV